MKNSVLFVLVLLAVAVAAQSAAQATNDPGASPPAATSKPSMTAAPSKQKPKAPPAATTPPLAGQRAAATPNTYTGAQGKKPDPGTACSSARLKKDGSLDCGMSGKAAAPPHPK